MARTTLCYPGGRAQGRMVLDAENDIFAKKRQHLFGLLYVEIVGMPNAGAEADTGHQELACLLHRFGCDHKVGDVVHKIIHPPDVDVPGKKPHRHFDYIVRI